VLAKAPAAIDTRARRREATKERILEAAWYLARRDGLAALSLRDLGDKVGMRAPSLYRYFPSKNAMYDAMYLESVNLLGQAVDERPKSADPRQALRQRAQRFVRFLTNEPLRFQLIDQRPIPGFEPTPASFAVAVANVANVKRDLEAAGARGDRALDMWRALVTGLVNQQISNDPGGHRWTRLLDDAIEMFLAHFAEGRS
jgi:AcrR family transcriptional regulator